MARQKVEEAVDDLVTPIAATRGLEVWDVQYVKEGGQWYLRILLDKHGGIGVDDCQAVSEELGEILDRTDLISGNYFLEVSSPGLERALRRERDFERTLGKKIRVTTFAPVGDKKHVTGILEAVAEGAIVIRTEADGPVTVPLAAIAKAKTVFDF